LDGFLITSLILTLTGKSNVISTTYSSAIDLNDDNYEVGLMNFKTYNTIPNVNASIINFILTKMTWKLFPRDHTNYDSLMSF